MEAGLAAISTVLNDSQTLSRMDFPPEPPDHSLDLLPAARTYHYQPPIQSAATSRLPSLELDGPIELLSQGSEEEADDKAASAASVPAVAARRVRVVIRGGTRVLRWYKGTTTSELLQQVRDLAHLSAAAGFRLRDTSTREFVELTPTLPSGMTLELVEEEARPALGATAAATAAGSASAESTVPWHWTTVRSDEDPMAAVELPDLMEAVEQSDVEAWSSLSTSLSQVGEITKIVRCESPDLWSTFVLEKKKLLKRFRAQAAKEQRSGEWRCGPGCWPSGFSGQGEISNVSGPVEERLLFHTAKASVDAIFQEGFDLRLASAGNFGKGIYFSDDPVKCDQYWRDGHIGAPTDGTRVMFVAQVLLGECKVYSRGQTDRTLVREPERCSLTSGYGMGRSQQHTTDRVDSVQGFISTANEYVSDSTFVSSIITRAKNEFQRAPRIITAAWILTHDCLDVRRSSIKTVARTRCTLYNTNQATAADYLPGPCR